MLSLSSNCLQSAVQKPFATDSLTHEAHLSRLPTELHDTILDFVSDEDALGRLGATSRYWQAMVVPRLYPTNLSSVDALRQGRRHALGRALEIPEDASRFVTGVRDDDDMTHLMHTVLRGQQAMLRCLLRHCIRGIESRDCAGFTAQDYATLVGLPDVLPEPSSQQIVNESQDLILTRLDVHSVIECGHAQLARALVSPHQAQGWRMMPSVAAVQHNAALSCGRPVLLCALGHVRRNRPIFRILAEAINPEALGQAALGVYAGAIVGDFCLFKQPLKQLGELNFDIHAETNGRPSLYTTWLNNAYLTLYSAQGLHAISGDILAPTPFGALLFDKSLDMNAPLGVPQNREGVIRALIKCGARPRAAGKDIDAAARLVLAKVYMGRDVWRTLEDAGARLDATDANGQGLAHAALSIAGDWRTDTLLMLQESGLDITRTCSASINAGMSAFLFTVPSEYWCMLTKLHSAGFNFGGPGHIRVNGQDFDAANMLEAALFADNSRLAVWLVKNRLCCSLRELTQARRNLDARGVPYDRAWLSKRIQAGRLGLR